MSLKTADPATHCTRVFALCLALAGASSAHAAGTDSERSRLAEERSAIELRFVARERECRERFVVTSCVEDARRDRRQSLDALKSRQLQLDEAQRRERTAERRAELAAKAAEDARRDQERAARAASAPAPRREPRPLEPRREGGEGSSAPRMTSKLRDHPGGLGGAKSGRGESAAERQEREAHSRASYDERQRKAAEHRDKVAKEAAERLRRRPPAASLPVPASAPTR